jgi:hypothetical protein
MTLVEIQCAAGCSCTGAGHEPIFPAIRVSTARAQLRALGFDTVVEQKWRPLAVADTHFHPFEARALVVQGEM